MRTLHQRGSDKRQTPDPSQKEHATGRLLEDFLIFLCRPLGSIHVLEDATGEGCQELTPRFDRGSLLVQTSMCVQADLSRCLTCWVLWVVEDPLLSYEDVLGGFEGLWRMVARDRQRNRGFFSGMLRGVPGPCEGSKILTFHFRPRLMCAARSYISEARGETVRKGVLRE